MSYFIPTKDFVRVEKFLLLITVFIFITSKTLAQEVYKSDELTIVKLAESTFQHITYLETEDYGTVACNGMIVINGNEAAVFDTPSNDEVSEELIKWIENEQKATIKGVVINHAHIDCLGGLKAFHDRSIPSYSSKKTINKALIDKVETPLNGFDKEQKIKVGKETIINLYPGEAHTAGNIVSYVKKDEVLFGGCMLKAMNAKQGNTADANLEEWSNTIKVVKKEFKALKIAIPGHGKVGGMELLDYTAALFFR